MNFADLFFLYFFLPLCLLAYFFARNTRQKNVVLVVFSLIFYAWGEPTRIIILIVTALVNWLLARAVESNRGSKAGKVSLIVSLVFNIGMLGIFKYTDFIIGNINGLFGTSIPLQNIGFLLGVSFYTFRMISYMLDVYWEKVEAQKNFGKMLMYVSLFPTIVAGPIVRYQTIENDIDVRKTSLSDLTEGATRIVIGLSKKVLLSNNLGLLASSCFGENVASASVFGTWMGVIAYSMQVYFDFSGYSDMAIGLGRIFGFHFDENFNYPFICRSISEFWQRWHISLGSFFRDYLFYLPLFGKRRAYLSLLLVWFTTGLWHGASWNYVIWGLYFGFFIFLETLIGKKRLKKIPTVIMHIYNKLVIIVGFGIFRFENLGDLGSFFKNLVGVSGNALTDKASITAVKSYLFVLLIAVIACLPIAPLIKKLLSQSPEKIQAVGTVCLAAFAAVLLFADTSVLVATFSSNNLFLYGAF